jgi:hypothetical protein
LIADLHDRWLILNITKSLASEPPIRLKASPTNS